MTRIRTLAMLAASATVAACSTAVIWPELPLLGPQQDVDAPQADAATRPRYEQAAAALTALRASPRDEGCIIWYGRRLAYLGHFDRAIAVYAEGLRLYPESPRLLRHRGHRYISTRRFALAVKDLRHASERIRGAPDEVEPDGIPNARNTPTSTLHTNIWYHLGLAHYCRGEFVAALRCYQNCLAAAKNPDMEVATRYWMFLAATRIEDAEQASRALASVRADWEVIENHAYHQLLLLFRGDRRREDLRRPDADAVQNATMDYGLARHLYVIGDAIAGLAALQKLAASGAAAFGCIAAEADLAHISR